MGRGLAVGLALLAWGSGTAAAATLTEIGDTGDLPSTAQSGVEPFGTPMDDIVGTIGTNVDVDMFRIFISDASTFSATTTNAGTVLEDTMLYLFDENGLGVLANDDTSLAEYTSTIPAGFLPAGSEGTYFIAVSILFNSPLSAGGDIWNTDNLGGTTTALSPDGVDAGDGADQPVNGWDIFPFSDDSGAYRIDLNGTTFVPEPSTALLLGMGLAGLGWGSRPRRPAKPPRR
jgi:hypothetical protein